MSHRGFNAANSSCDFRRYYSSHDNQQHVYNCLKMALDDSALAEELGLDYIATRLEDIPREDVMRAFANWLGVDFRESMLRSTWAGLDWHGDRISNKTFAATGWSETRTENGWQQRLGRIDKFVLNYIMNDRLSWYRYSVKPVGPLDAVLAALAIPLPFKCERRFLSLRHVWTTLRNGSNQMRLQLLFTPFFYARRVKLCYRHYLRTLRGVKFTGNWIQALSQPHPR